LYQWVGIWFSPSKYLVCMDLLELRGSGN
jgi:hypothetical protein